MNICQHNVEDSECVTSPTKREKGRSWKPVDVKSGNIATLKKTSSPKIDHSIEKLRQENRNFEHIFKKIRQESDVRKIRNQIDSQTESILSTLEKQLKQTEPMKYQDGMRLDVQYQNSIYEELHDHFKVVLSKPDGNCFFESISLSLFGNSEYTNHLRLLQVDHILKENLNLRRIEKCFGKTIDQVD